LERAQKKAAEADKHQRTVASAQAEIAALKPQLTEAAERLEAARNQRRAQAAAWAKPQVSLNRYAAEQSFDVYLWQTLERQQQFIAQGLSKDLNLRTIEEVDGAALSYSEVKALATGDQRVIERAGLEGELRRLEMVRNDVENRKWRAATVGKTGRGRSR
jgi:hypothetical protein